MYCMEYLASNTDWLLEKLEALKVLRSTFRLNSSTQLFSGKIHCV